MPSGAWTHKTPIPVAISEVGVGQIDGKVYVIGGTDKTGQATNFNLTYDPATDRWEERATLPRALHHIGVTALGGKLYAIGGLTANVHIGPQSLTLSYDPKLDRWSELEPLSSPRGSLGVAAVAGKIHIFGGRKSPTSTVTTHDVYDPVSGKWTQRTPLSGPPRDHMGIAVVEEKIHVFGGRINDYNDMLDRHDVYEPNTDTWTTAASLPRPRSAGAFVVLNGRIIYAGGECKPGGRPFTPNAFDDVDAYDTKTGTWSSLTPLPEGRHAFGAAAVDGVAYFAGGALLCGGGASADLLALTI